MARRTTTGRALAGGLIAAAIALAAPGPARAADTAVIDVTWHFETVMVTTANDHDDGTCTASDCTLREALLYAPSGSRVFVPAGTYNLPNGELLSSTQDLTVIGAGARSTTIGNPPAQNSVLHVTGGTLNLSGVEITGAPSASRGGGIAVDPDATLNLSSSAVTQNAAIELGGGIYNEGTLTVAGSTIADNSIIDGTGGGGLALDVGSATTVTNSTISGNDGQGNGGGILLSSSLSLQNTTIAGNKASDGGALSEADDNSIDIGNTILAKAPSSALNTCALPTGATGLVATNSLADDASCALSANGGTGNLESTDPKLGPLQDNPIPPSATSPTDTQAPAAGSPPIDAGDDGTCLPTDQRGLTRPQGDHCDIGAYEAFVAAAPETVGHIDGGPLDVYADGAGSLQVRFDGQSQGEFFAPESNPGHAGLELRANGILLFGQPVSGPTLSSPAPGTHVLHSVYDETDFNGLSLEVTEDVTYVDGTGDVKLHYAIRYTGSGAVDVSAGELADLYIGGSDTGAGVLQGTAPHRFVGGQSPTGAVSGLTEVTPWSHFQESDFGSVFENFEQGTRLTDTIDPTQVDNGVGAQWDMTLGTPAATPTPSPTPTPTPTPAPTATPTPTPDPNLPAPTYGKTFNAEQSTGLVRYKLPRSNKYVTLTAGAQIPTGTTIDTTKGRVTLTSVDKKGRAQHADFYEGIFKLAGQTKDKKPVTLLTLNGPKPQCGKAGAKKSSAVVARKRRSRHLWGNGKGNFRTTGQYSSATVRGTIWLTQDSCDGTLVKVKRGIVAVKDFTRHKTFLVKAGHSHLAPPPGRHGP